MTNKFSLTSDITVITAEINSFKQMANQSLFEIGKRLKHVKDNDLTHGQWAEWVEGTIDIKRQTATRMIQAYEQFGTTSYHLPSSKIFEMLSLPESVDREEFLQHPHIVPSTGEEKTVDEMTTRELREVKIKLQQVERENQQLEAKYTLAINQHTEQQEKLLQQLEELMESKTKDSPDTLKRISQLEQELAKVAKLSGENLELKQTIEKQREEYKAKMISHDESRHDLRKMKESLSKTKTNVELDLSTALMHFNSISDHREAIQFAENFWAEFEETVMKYRQKWNYALNNPDKEVRGHANPTAVIDI